MRDGREPRRRRLPVSVHRGRRARRARPPERPGGLGRGQGGGERLPAGGRPSSGRAAEIERAAAAMAARFDAGGRLFAFGNGGSATDAAGVAALFRRPPWGTPLPAASLAADEAVITALANDVGFELVFSRQLMATGPRIRCGGGPVDQRQLDQPSPCLRRGPAAGSADCRPRRRTRRAHGRLHRPRSLPGRGGRERPPDPGDLRPRWYSASGPGSRVVWASGGVHTDERDPIEPRSGRARSHRGVPPAPYPLHRRGHHPGPRRRRQGVGRPDRRRLCGSLRQRQRSARWPTAPI